MSDEMRAVSPALDRFTRDAIGGLWKRPQLSERDRAIVTMAALLARNQTAAIPDNIDLAFDSGVTAVELSEIVTHLAFYAGWPNALAAVPIFNQAFTKRGIRANQLPEESPKMLAIDETAETQRANAVEQNFGAVAPGVVENTTKFLFRNLWLRPALAPRDRSLITVAALIASGQVAQITYHLNRAMDNGLTKEQASEVLTHLAFYSGWPCVFSAMPIFKQVFEGR
jgi:4-carboxymuconolactone decarboxylase